MKYTGTLKKLITKRRLSLLGLEDEYPVRAEYQRQIDEALSKLPALFAAHEVPPMCLPACWLVSA